MNEPFIKDIDESNAEIARISDSEIRNAYKELDEKYSNSTEDFEQGFRLGFYQVIPSIAVAFKLGMLYAQKQEDKRKYELLEVIKKIL